MGAFIGLLAGFFGGWTDTMLMRLVDISLSLPGILIAVLLSVVFEPSFTNVIIVVVFLLWPSYARLVRGETLASSSRTSWRWPAWPAARTSPSCSVTSCPT